MELRRRVSPYLFLMPAFLAVLFSELLPASYTIYLSFMNWNYITSPSWTGISNYIRLFSEPQLLKSLVNTLYWVAGTFVFGVALALILAVAINGIKTGAFFKTVFYLPVTLSPAIVGVFWYVVYSTQPGAVNSLLRTFGLSRYVRAWLMDGSINTSLMIGSWIWQFMGLNLILFLVGLQSIPKEFIEAAQVDGAGPNSTFLHITLPLLRPITMLVIANTMINTVRMFDIPWVMVHGGPARVSETLAITMYRESFLLFNMGFGSAIAVFISAITLLLSWRYLRVFRPEISGLKG